MLRVMLARQKRTPIHSQPVAIKEEEEEEEEGEGDLQYQVNTMNTPPLLTQEVIGWEEPLVLVVLVDPWSRQP